MNKLIFIGLGLFDYKDIPCKGLEILKNADKVFAEFYTAKMAKGTIENLEMAINNRIEVLTRAQVEDGQIILDQARKVCVAFVCQGDPLTATTHIDLLLRAKELNIPVKVIHGSSAATAIPGLLGLQFYKFGRTTTLAYPEGEYFPESPYDVIAENLQRGLHTLVLLDINETEKRYMTANEGIELLLRINRKRRPKDRIFTPKTLTCVVARAGSDQPYLAANTAEVLLKMDFGEPLHSLVIPGKLHFKEQEALIVLANAPKEFFGF